MAKYTHKDLKQYQAMPMEAKVTHAMNRINDWYDHYNGKVYISFSGGKDSTVLKHIVDSMYGDEIPAVFCNTGLEYPESVDFVKRVRDGKVKGLSSNVEIIRPELSFKQVLDKAGYPIISKEQSGYLYDVRHTNSEAVKAKRLDLSSQFSVAEKYRFLIDAPFEISNKCCELIKKKPMNKYAKETGRNPMVGLLAIESRLRTNKWLKTGCNAFDATHPQSMPLAIWTVQDIYEYIKSRDVEISPAYGEIWQNYDGSYGCGVHQLGCMFCLYGLQTELQPNRFQKMAVEHPKLYNYCMKPKSEGGIGIRDVIDWVNKNSDLDINLDPRPEDYEEFSCRER